MNHRPVIIAKTHQPVLRIDVITLFPELFETHLATSLLGRAVTTGVVEVALHDLRAHGIGPHRSVDDATYGGGAGMVLRPEPIFEAVEEVSGPSAHVVLLSARGARLDQRGLERLAALEQLVLICGRYEGVDERVATHLADEELSIGDYVLAGGELPALVVIEGVSRLMGGVLGNAASLASESHTGGGLEYPQYTRPAVYRGLAVPEVLLSGDHSAVERWRAAEAERLTRRRRPELFG